MFPASSDFKNLVRESHEVITKVEVLRDGSILAVIYPESGAVEVDARRAVRRTCSITLRASGSSTVLTPTYNTYAQVLAQYATYTALAAVSSYSSVKVITGYDIGTAYDVIIPSSASDLITPYGNELKIYRGITFQRRRVAASYATIVGDYATYAVLAANVANYQTINDRTGPWETVEEYVPLGVFVITDVDIDDAPDGVTVNVTGADRSIRISRARWTDPYKVAKGTAVETAIGDLLADRWSSITTAFTATGATTTLSVLGVDTENDPWQDAVKLADAVAFDLYFDQDGICVLSPKRDYTDVTGDETYVEGTEAMVLGAQRRLTSEGVYNAVVVSTEGTEDVQFRSTALDDDPASPTYVYGPFGLVPTFRSSPLINTQAAADKYAAAVLNQIKGTTEAIAWNQLVDPSLDAGDTVTVVNTGARIARTLVLDRITIPLAASESMGSVARTIRTVDEEQYLVESIDQS